jgi:hypothetical protein
MWFEIGVLPVSRPPKLEFDSEYDFLIATDEATVFLHRDAVI